MFIKIMCIIGTVVLMLFLNKMFIENKQKSSTHNLVLFKDNGNRIRLANANSTKKEIDAIVNNTTTKVSCNLKTLVKCNTSTGFECFECDEPLAKCIHFEQDEDIYNEDNKSVIGQIKANTAANEGYCLRLEGKDKRTCTPKNGGRWIIVERNDKYTYVCMCTNPEIFSRTTLHGDCTHFNFCRNGKIANIDKWKSFDDIVCDCDENYRQIIRNNRSECIRKNIFQRNDTRLPFQKLDRKYIDDSYIGKDLNLPNPCTFNPSTRTDYAPGIAKIQMSSNIAYCVALSPLHTTVLYEDDYLRNNRGRYANGVVEISRAPPISDTIYEPYTKKRNSNDMYDHVFSGRRYLHEDVTLELPALDTGSQNLGGPGRLYPYSETFDPKYRTDAYVYVWNAPDPSPQNINYGNTITYVPTYTFTFNSNYRSYYGTIPSVNVPILPCDSYHIISLGKGFRKWPYLNNPLVPSEYMPIDDKAPRTNDYTMPMICKKNNKQIVQIYSKTFTGLFLTYTYSNKVYSKPISPGKILVDKYRFNLDADWKSFDDHKNQRIYITNEPFTLASHFNDRHQFGENSYTFDCGEGYAMPGVDIARYKCGGADGEKWLNSF